MLIVRGIGMGMLFIPITALSLSNQNITSKDTTIVMTTLFYYAKPKLKDSEKEKLENWMLKKYKIAKIELITK